MQRAAGYLADNLATRSFAVDTATKTGLSDRDIRRSIRDRMLFKKGGSGGSRGAVPPDQ